MLTWDIELYFFVVRKNFHLCEVTTDSRQQIALRSAFLPQNIIKKVKSAGLFLFALDCKSARSKVATNLSGGGHM